MNDTERRVRQAEDALGSDCPECSKLKFWYQGVDPKPPGWGDPCPVCGREPTPIVIEWPE